MTQKNYIVFGIFIAGVIGLLVFARAASEPREIVNRMWPGTEVTCLIFGHQNLASHIHPLLKITVDGTEEQIPANIGIDQGCMAEVHTHDATGQLHIESTIHGKLFKMSDFFAVWGRTLEREGYTVAIIVNGAEVDPSVYEFADADQVEIRYTSLGAEPVVTPEPEPAQEQPTAGSIQQESDIQFEVEL